MEDKTDKNLLQKIYDFMESSNSPISRSLPLHHETIYLTLKEKLGEAIDWKSVEILRKVSSYLKENGNSEEPTSDLNKLVVSKLLIDGHEASICRTSWVSSFNRPKVFEFTDKYEYIEVIVGQNRNEKRKRVIVDMDFRSQFELARSTEAFKKLTDSIPLVFVGSEEKLKQVIGLVCFSAKKSLKEMGLHVPPWRKSTYMHSKWFSRDCKRTA